MSVILILILVSLSLALGFLACFVWAVRSGQYEDTTTPSMRILTEDDAGLANSAGRKKTAAFSMENPTPKQT
jgi:cbb3-type cytochrome oxidase maturation protein